MQKDVTNKGVEENRINLVCVFTRLILHFSQFSMQLMKAYVAETSWYRLYYENEGLSDMHAEGEARGHVYSMKPSLNCVTSLYQNATNEIHLAKMVALRNCRMQCHCWHFHHYCLRGYVFMVTDRKFRLGCVHAGKL